jgi:hypothetical protein
VSPTGDHANTAVMDSHNGGDDPLAVSGPTVAMFLLALILLLAGVLFGLLMRPPKK